MATTTAVLKRRVERGAALLDAEQPGWAPRIDVPTLRMRNPFSCVLGQLYGNYGKGLGALDLNAHTDGYDYGFHTYGPSRYINPLWREAIEARCGGSER